MKKRVVLILSIVFVFVSILIILFTIFSSKRYETSKVNLSRKSAGIKKEIDNNSRKLEELIKQNDNKKKSEENMSSYIKDLEEKVKSYEN